MANSQAFLVIGYEGGAVARIAFADDQKAIEEFREVIDAVTKEAARDVRLFTRVGTHALVRVTQVVFAYVERTDGTLS